MQYPFSSGFNYPTMSADAKLREIPVMHESSRHGSRSQQPGPQWQQQQYPQPRTPPRISTPPRVATPPRTEGTSPRFYTLPRNHKDRVQETVREIPIQHFTSRPMSPARPPQGHQEASMPRPDYPGAMGQHDMRQPGPQQYPGTLPRAAGHAQTYPGQNMTNQQYPGQGYPQTAPVSQPQSYPHGQGYPAYPQGPPMPQPQGPAVSQTSYPQPPTHQYPQQGPRPQMSDTHQPSPPPAAANPQCRPPEQQQEVLYNIPIVRDTQKQPGQPSEPQPRQFTPDRQFRPESQQGQKTPKEGSHSREGSYDQLDHGANINNNGQKQDSVPSNQTHSERQKKQPRTPLDDISDILQGCKQYEERVMTFNGTKADKEYKLLEEMMTRGILKLDGIESGSDVAIRQARKAAVREIQSYLDQLELKAFSANVPKPDPGNGGNSSSDGQTEAMDTSNAAGRQSESDTNVKEMVLGSEVSC